MRYDHDLRNAGYSQEDLYVHQLEHESNMEALDDSAPLRDEEPPKPQRPKASGKRQKYEPPEGLGYAIGLMF